MSELLTDILADAHVGIHALARAIRRGPWVITFWNLDFHDYEGYTLTFTTNRGVTHRIRERTVAATISRLEDLVRSEDD